MEGALCTCSVTSSSNDTPVSVHCVTTCVAVRMSRVRRWCMTWNNPDLGANDDHPYLQLSDDMRYLCAGFHEETQTKHVHLYVEFKKSMRLSAVRRLYPGMHCEPARGNAEQNKTYIGKYGNSVLERGTPAIASQGSRSDLEDIKTAIDSGASEEQLYNEHFPTMVRYSKGLHEYIHLCKNKKRRLEQAPTVEVFWGPTGTGKSTKVATDYPDAFWVTRGNTGVWWNGYAGEETVVFDDFRPSWERVNTVIKWLDRWPVTVPVHGGARQLVAHTFIFTSNTDPVTWYAGHEQWEPLQRRITLVHKMEVQFV